jgi:DNA-binding transcriptional ArsR family regulator
MFTLVIVQMTTAQIQQIKDEFDGRQQVCEHVVGLFQLLSNKVRFRIVCMLMHGEACVQQIAEVVADGQMSNISQQLRMLRLAGVVEKRRDKKQILYRVEDERITRLTEFLRREFLQANHTT